MKRLLTRFVNALERAIKTQGWLAQQPAMLGWAALTGILGGLATMLFHEGIVLGQSFFLRQTGEIDHVMHELPWALRLVVPALGGLVAGALLVYSRRFGNDRPSDYMESVAIGDGRLPLREGLLRSLSSLFSVISGGSIGREGAMVHLGAMGASLLGRVAPLDRSRLRLVVACGAAAGVASAYGAPIAGALFVAEIVLGTMAIQTVGPLLVAAASSHFFVSLMGAPAVGYRMGDIPTLPLSFIGPAILLGIVSGLGAPYFLKWLDFARSLFRMLKVGLPLRLAFGGLLLGCVLAFMPSVAGNGYGVVQSLLTQPWPWYAVLLVLLGKLLATGFTVGSGAVGGVFTPTIFVGAVIGTLCGQFVGFIWPSLGVSPFVYTAVGMGAFLAAGTSAPLMAILMIFEMTHNYSLVLPLMVACVLAYYVARAIAEVAMYEVTLTRERDAGLRHRLRNTLIGDLIRPAVTVVATGTPVSGVVQMFSEYPVRYVYVVDEDSVFIGVIAQQDVTHLLVGQGDIAEKTAGDILRLDFAKPLYPDMNLDDAQSVFVNFTGERLPVVSHGEQPKLLGVVYKSAVLEKYFALKKTLDSGADALYF